VISLPDALVDEIAERRCAIILGAGASAASKSFDGSTAPKNWTELLQAGISKIANEDDREAAKELLDKQAYLDAAQIMFDSLEAADFNSFINSEFKTPNFQPSEIHKLVLRIDPKIVITTNYDSIFENYAQQGGAVNAYNVNHYYETHLINDLRSRERIIIKAHGCVTDPQKIILTRRQYFEARRNYPQFFSALDAIFLTHTLLFIGSGFAGDPDIELLLQNSYISSPSELTHYAIIEEGRHKSVIDALESTYNITFYQYEKGKHGELVDALRVLADEVDLKRSVPK